MRPMGSVAEIQSGCATSPTGAMAIGGPSAFLAGTFFDLLHIQRPRRTRPKQLLFWLSGIEPGRPLTPVEDDHLSVVDGRDVRPGRTGEHSENSGAVLDRTPNARDAEPILPSLRESPLGLRIAGPGEFIKMRSGHQASTVRKAAPLRAHVDDGRAFGASGRKAPFELHELRPILGGPDDGGPIGWPDIIPRFEVGWAASREISPAAR